MKKHILTIVVVLLAMVPSAFAYDFSVQVPSGQTLYFNITGPSEVEVTYGDITPAGNLEIPASVDYESTTYFVTSIGEYAFQLCTGLTSISIPNTISSIGDHAFETCTGLTSISIPNTVSSIGDYAFTGCGFTSINIPNSVYYIGNNAFADCRWLTSINIPNSVTSIGSEAFAGCYGLTSISVEGGNTVYDSREGCNAIIKTATNTLIAGCMNTIIPNSVTSIGRKSFAYCYGLTSVSIPNSVTSIGYGAFESCTGLTSISIPSSVTSIEGYAIAFCTGLTSISIPSSVTSIGYAAIACCSEFTSISVESGNAVYDSREGCNAVIETATNTLITGCMNTVIPNSVTSIGEGAFAACNRLTSVSIPSLVTSIGNWAFENCYGLTSVNIPNSVTSIGNGVFYGCHGLTSIECLAEMPPSVGYYGFNDVPDNISIYVPCGKVSAYQSAGGWGSFSNIQEVDGCTSAGPTSVAIYAEGNDVVVEGADGNTVTLYNNAGNLLTTSTAPSGTPLRFEGLTSGTYYVKIGVLPARMKVEIR